MTVVLGPVRCMGCGRMVTWNGREWTEHGTRHRCDPLAALPITRALSEVAFSTSVRYNRAVGISDAITDTMCDARSVADPSRAGVSRLEGSDPDA